MRQSLAKRLADLEQLERERAQPPERVLCAFLQIRPADYAVLVGLPRLAAARVFVAYGLDRIGDGERVNVWGGTWPYPLAPTHLTMYHDQDAEGYGIRIDAWPLYDDAPAPSEWRWVVARGE